MNLDELNKIINFVQPLIDHLNGGEPLTKFFIYVILTLIIISLVLAALRLALEQLASIIENFKKIGFSYTTSDEQKITIRRRQQFCAVLRSDLDSIAKAENWNDQWFTDLEAEVEADGSYYTNAIARLLNYRSNGIRRTPSLIQAIQTSTERCMLLVGDPGSGKSIALRHLGRTLADEGSKSKDTRAKVPLYINLKEMPPCDSKDLNSDFIENFVIEHIRRGDADTAAYVRDHWQSYKTQGIWLFLFDSFDEIPAVLHAPNGSKTIEHYSQALRKFMNGMGECRGVLASREYKGPEALPWQKLRILALNQQRQDELIDNTYLSTEHKTLVRQHLATITGGIFGNPLFMTLLCRYVRESQQCPTNDYDLLLKHIERLAHRDPDFIIKRYGLSEKQLIEGATLLAVLFAEEPKLSLAPKYDEIGQALKQKGVILPVDLERLLSALIDVKIGRSDVKEAHPGDRRFTFSHRRYQETLFVQYLAQHPQHIPADKLLLDDRWREFVVTLIQSQPEDIIIKIGIEAAKIIDSLQQVYHKLPKQLNEELYYFDWEQDSLLHLLKLLNEGFSKRPKLVPSSLRGSIAQKLLPRWQNGDLYDRLMVIRYGCLLPDSKYQELLQCAISSGIDPFLQASFTNAQYLSDLDSSMTKWIRVRFSDEVLVADNKIELLKLDAMGNRLPRSIGAPIIFKRCKALRSIVFQPFILRSINESLETIFNKLHFGNRMQANKRVSFVMIIPLYIALISFVFIGKDKQEATQISTPLLITISILVIAMIILLIWLMLRAQPASLSINYLLFKLKETRHKWRTTSIQGIISNFKIFGIALLITISFIWISIKFQLIALILTMIIVISPVLIVINEKNNERKALQRLQKLVANEYSFWEQIKQANTSHELLIWLKSNSDTWLSDTTHIRNILCYAEKQFRKFNTNTTSDQPEKILSGSKILARYLLAKLELKFETKKT